MVTSASPTAANDAAPVKIAILGDSLTAGYGLPLSEAFPAKLEAALKAKGHNVQIINAGVSGDTSSQGLARLEWSLSPETSGMIVELGGNDALRALPPETTRKNITEIIEKLQARNIKVLLAGMMAPPNLGEQYQQEFNTLYPELADQFDIPLYPFFLDGVAGNNALLQSDGIHPTAEGVDEMVKRFLPTAEAFLKTLAE